MAQELSLEITATQTKNNVTLAKSWSSSFTVNGDYPIMNRATIGTSDETLAIGDVGTLGWLFMRNQDGTNFITFGSDGAVYPIKLKAGEFAALRWNGAAIHAKADTAACALEYLLLPD
jgi:hypothetical protein